MEEPSLGAQSPEKPFGGIRRGADVTRVVQRGPRFGKRSDGQAVPPRQELLVPGRWHPA